MVREKKNSDKGAAGDCSTDAGTLLLRTIKEHRQVIKRPSFFPAEAEIRTHAFIWDPHSAQETSESAVFVIKGNLIEL